MIIPFEGQTSGASAIINPFRITSKTFFKKHFVALDGLRGIAILMVMVVHFYAPLAHEINDVHPMVGKFLNKFTLAGVYGVPLFFVLSGFLITGILLDTKDKPGAARKFYMRRTLRIFPLYYGALVLVIFVLPWLMELDQGAKTIVAKQGWLWTYLANFPTAGWPWDDSNIFMLGHFWSLCVEEHFYLVWPAVVFLLPVRKVFGVSIVIVVAAIACRAISAFASNSAPPLFRWSTLTTVDCLAFGAIIAVMLREPSLNRYLPRGRSFWIVFSIFFVLFLGIAALPRSNPLRIVEVFGHSILGIFFSLVILGAVRLEPGNRFNRILSSGILVTFGKYSYGLYVIHGILRPAFEKSFQMFNPLARLNMPIASLFLYYVFAIGVSFAIAYLSFHLFEKRFLALKRYFDY